MNDNEHPATDAAKLLERGLNEMPSAPSRRRGRPPRNLTILAPPQESEASHQQEAPAVAPEPVQAPTVPSPLTEPEPPLPAVVADDVDLREVPAMAAKHSLSGSDSKVRGASEVIPPIEAGKSDDNPALPEQFHGATGTSVEADGQRHISIGSSSHVHNKNPGGHGACPVEPPPQPSWTPVQVGDVVQINSSQNKRLGTLFIIGDIENHRVHGYQIGLGGKLEYFTVNEDECILVGPMTRGQIRSRSSCSARWKADKR